MKKCTSCAKDLPDAAMHCVFCGTKQPAAPPAGANAKTVMGWQASDLLKDMAASGAQPAPGVAMPPPAAPPPAAPPPAAALGVAQTLAAPPGGSPMAVAQTLAAPPTAQPNAAAAKTMFAAQPPQLSNPGAAAFPPAMTMPAPSAYGGPGPSGPAPGHNPGAAAFPPAVTMPAPSAYGGPPAASPAASAATMFAAPAPQIPGAGGFGGPGSGQPGGMPPGPMPGAGMPPGGGFPPPYSGGPAPGGGFAGGPLPGAGMPPGQQPPAYQPPYQPPAYQPPPMQQPMMQQPMMQQAPPYLASRTAARAGAPREPFADGLRLVLIIFGALLIAAFVAPLTLHGKTVFRWDVLSGEGGAVAKFDQIYLAAAGVLALVFGAVSLANVPRGLLAAVLGLAPIALHFVLDLKDAPKFRWQEVVEFAALLTLVPGLMLRSEYRSQMLPRLLVTIGAVCVLLPMLVPEGGADPKVKMIIDGIGKAEGKAKILAILQLYPVVLAALALLCWLPAPSSGGAKIIAWMFIVGAVVATYTALLVMGHIGDVVKRSFSDTLFGGWVIAAWVAFIGYGLATVLGKNLEHS